MTSSSSHGLISQRSNHVLSEDNELFDDDMIIDADNHRDNFINTKHNNTSINPLDMHDADSPSGVVLLDRSPLEIIPGSLESKLNGLQRSLTVTDGLGIIVGIIIGSGIFSSPGVTLERAGSPGAAIISWFVSGILVFLAAQCYMELGGMMPTAGGDFDYLRRGYGERVAFSFAWFYFFISKTGSAAMIALVFGRYISVVFSYLTGANFFGEENISRGRETYLSKICALSIIIILSAINCHAVSESAYLQKIMTILKILIVVVLFIIAIAYIISVDSSIVTSNFSINTIFRGTNGITSFGSSLVSCLWSFDGWADLNFMQEELVNPQRDFVRTMILGIGIVTTVYILANIAYLSLLPISEIKSSNTIAIDVGHTIDYAWDTKTLFAIIFAFSVAFSAAGSLNGTIMTGGRVFYAVSRAGYAPKMFSQLNSFGSPSITIISQGVWASVLILLPGSSFAVLLDYYGCMSWLYYALVSFTVVILRYKEPSANRPYRAMFYPLPPLIVVCMACAIIISSFASQPVYTSFAFGSVLISFPVHYYFFRQSPQPPHPLTSYGIVGDLSRHDDLSYT